MKRIKKDLLTIALLTTSVVTLNAKGVDEIVAAKVAKNYYYQQAHYFDTPIAYDAINFSDVQVEYINDTPVMYVFNIPTGGFVLVSADDAMYPVLGYCYEEGVTFDMENRGQNYKSFISSMMHTVHDISKAKIAQEEKIAKEWSLYTTDNHELLIATKDDQVVGPLITSNWNQDYPYNYYAPLDEGGSGGRTYAGCVATAMAVQMYYFGYPFTGEGSSSYYCSGYGMQSAYYEDAYYDWNAMPNEVTKNDETDAVLNVALIQRHCGVSVRMMYSPDGSGAYSDDVDEAVREHFKYPYASYVQRNNSGTWETMLTSQLDQGYPLYYSGQSPTEGGHAFNCDGYRIVNGNQTFHFNFNWGGYYNEWYSSSSPSSFSNSQAVVKDFYPDPSEYPTYFITDLELNSKVGRVDDGSGPIEYYLPGTYNTWIINPQSDTDTITNITFSFEKFDLSEGDVVNVYDGADKNAPLLGSYQGGATDLPQITSTGNKMYVEFIGNGNAQGFIFTYKANRAKWCNTTNKLESEYGTIVSNPDSKYYNPKTLCRWNMTYPESEDGGYIKFNYLQTFDENDFVQINDFGTGESYVFYGMETPDQIINYGKEGFQVVFKTDGFMEEGSGFSLYFADFGFDGIEDATLNDILVYPNPANDKLNITLPYSEYRNLEYQIFNAKGMLVMQNNTVNAGEVFSINISELPAGAYIIKFIDNDGVSTKKFIVE